MSCLSSLIVHIARRLLQGFTARTDEAIINEGFYQICPPFHYVLIDLSQF